MKNAWLVMIGSVGLAAGLGSVRAAEPSIEEMLSVIEQKLSAPEPAGPAQPSRPGAKDKFERYKPASDAIEELQKKIEKKVGERMADYSKRKALWAQAMLYVDTQYYEKAWEILGGRFLADRVSYKEKGLISRGDAHREAARVAAIGGRAEYAEQLAKEASNRASAPHLQNMADGTARWVAAYKENKEKVEGWERAFAKNPKDGKLRWSLANSYRHNVCRYLDEVIALQDMLERFGDHKQVTRGEVEWRLAEGYSRYHLFDEATALYIKICKDYPKHSQVKRGEGWWRAGEGLRRQGKWKQARAYYQRIMKETPKHPQNQLRQNQQQTTLAQRIQECNRNIN